jgi:hypothetical protein
MSIVLPEIERALIAQEILNQTDLASQISNLLDSIDFTNNSVVVIVNAPSVKPTVPVVDAPTVPAVDAPTVPAVDAPAVLNNNPTQIDQLVAIKLLTEDLNNHIAVDEYLLAKFNKHHSGLKQPKIKLDHKQKKIARQLLKDAVTLVKSQLPLDKKELHFLKKLFDELH